MPHGSTVRFVEADGSAPTCGLAVFASLHTSYSLNSQYLPQEPLLRGSGSEHPVSPLITPIVVPYMFPHVTLSKEFRLQLWLISAGHSADFVQRESASLQKKRTKAGIIEYVLLPVPVNGVGTSRRHASTGWTILALQAGRHIDHRIRS